MSLDDLKYFLKVADSLNVTRASEQLGISQPTLSYSIKRLESELGDELIIRLKNGIQLTKLGEEFVKRAHKVIFEWEEMQKMTNPDSDGVTGEYKIGIHPSVALAHLGKFLPTITKKYPLLKFKLIHGLSREMTEKVISWEADFGIVVNPISHPDLVIKELTRDAVTLFGLKGAPKKMIYDPDLAQSRFNMKKVFFDESEFISTNSLEVVLDLTSLGLGYGLLPESIAKSNPKLIRLKEAPIFEDRICLIYRREKHRNEASRFVLKAILESY